VFPRWRVAVFVDGCFWHGCPEHGRRPHHNAAWWDAKFERNRRRDRDTDGQLESRGWAVVRVWEHEPPENAAERVLTRLAERGWRRDSGDHDRRGHDDSVVLDLADPGELSR
jgi:DNA mismatch endonuclease (patch repair protein)